MMIYQSSRGIQSFMPYNDLSVAGALARAYLGFHVMRVLR